MSSESQPSARRALLVSTVVLQIVLALIIAQTYQSGRNSLHNNGNWVSTKAELAQGVMGAVSFVYGLQPLAGGHLNLSAWHGYQEVMSKAEFDPASVELRFYMKPGGHLSVLLQEPDGDYVGVRMSKNKHYSSMVFRATRDGEFTFKQEIRRLRQFSLSEWHTFRIELDNERVEIYRDGDRQRTLELRVDSPLRVGFRGGSAKVLVDDIHIRERDGREALRESFGHPGNRLSVNLVCVGIVLGLSAALLLGLRRIARVTDQRLLSYSLMLTGVLVVIGLLLLGFGTYTKRFYPDASARLQRQEEYWKNSSREALFRRIESDYPRPPDPGTRRVVFLGSSQTKGSGARTLEETLVRQTERLLNDLPGDRRFECVDTAMNGDRIEDMVRGYLERWVHLEPSIVVLNASNNDIGYGQGQFRKWLTRLAERNRELGIELVLVMEPNSPERKSSLRKRHGILRAVGEKHGLLVIDMHDYLLERHDDGFLWWDWVHLTSFGQRLFAEELVRELSGLEHHRGHRPG
jgi:lysophospholipase L1-like esterase